MNNPILIERVKKVTFFTVILIAFFGLYFFQNNRYRTLESTHQVEIERYQFEKLEMEKELSELSDQLSEARFENSQLYDILAAEQEKIRSIERQAREAFSTIGTLDKLRRLDPELLQKYSKVYFLNEHYVPSSLSAIDGKFAHPEGREHQIHSQVLPFLTNLLEEAREDDIPLRVISAFRSFDSQASIKSHYVVVYGAGTANQFSADQGYSEHQLGTAIDFTTTDTGDNFALFKNTEAYKWLTSNAHRFGFILSYPEGNEYYQYEPWHWRFVGVELATNLYNNDAYFYEMDQREIDKFLVNIFD